MGLVTHWLYPTNEFGEYHLEDLDTGQRSPVSPSEVLRFIDAYPGQLDPWYLSQGFRSMRPDDLMWLYAAGEQVLYAVGRVDRVYRNDAHNCWYADIEWLVDETRVLATSPLPRSRFEQVPQAPVRANATAAGILDVWLEGWLEARAGGPDGESPRQEQPVRISAEILSRRGQPAFRRRLMAAYGGACAVTGETAEAVLEAAHISPFSESLSNDVSNGLLLRADVHTLFDLHLIAIDPSGRLEVAPQLAETAYAGLDGACVAVPERRDSRPSSALLADHRAVFRSRCHDQRGR
jgi:hypothetical protein